MCPPLPGQLRSRSLSCPALRPSQLWQLALLVPLASCLATMLWVPPAGPQGGGGRERREAGDSGQTPTSHPSAHPHVVFRQHLLACHRLLWLPDHMVPFRKIGRDADESSVLKVLNFKRFCSVFAGQFAGLTFLFSLSLRSIELRQGRPGADSTSHLLSARKPAPDAPRLPRLALGARPQAQGEVTPGRKHWCFFFLFFNQMPAEEK